MTHEDILDLARTRKIRLVVCDGRVRSAHDNDVHYIGPATLLHLYKIPSDVRVVYYPSTPHEFHGWKDTPVDVQLRPRYNGSYSLVDAFEQSGVSL